MKRVPFVAFVGLCFGAIALSSESDWISLFDGESLDGWKANENPETWTVEDGAMKANGDRSHLFYVGEVANHDFKNFEFEVEVMTKPGSNSGIYIHTKYQDEGWPAVGYECQVINSNPPTEEGRYIEHKMTGSIYAVRNTWRSPAKDNDWFTYRIVVSGMTIQTFIDDVLICEYTQAESPWRPDDKKERLLDSGTFAFQGHDPDSIVYYRDVRVRPLPDDAPSLGAPLDDPELDRILTRFANDNFPIIDLGINGEPASSVESQMRDGLKYGLTFGYQFPSEWLDIGLIGETRPIVILNDKEGPPSIDSLKELKESGVKFAFSSGGALGIDIDRLRARLEAIEAAGLEWTDFWVPGK